MTIINFPSPPLEVGETYEANGIGYTWDGQKWVANADRGRETMQAPEIGSVTLTDTGASGDRFTSEVFDVAVNMTENGDPASEKQLKIELGGAVVTRPSTDEISDVTTVPFADNFEINQLNDNNWSIVLWAGPPFNAYLAFSSGSSNDNMAWSADGRNWTRMASTYGGEPYALYAGSWTNNSVAYHPDLQALYTVYTRIVGGNYYADIRVMTELDGVWTDAQQSVASRSYGCGWGHLQWNEGAQRWSMCMTSVQNIGSHVNTTMMLSPVGQDAPTSGWVEIGGGNNYARYCQPHQDGSLTSDVQGWNNSNGWQRKVNLANNDAPQNIIPRNIGSNNSPNFSSFPMVAIGNPVTAWAYGSADTSSIYVYQGSAPPAGGSAFPQVPYLPAGTGSKLNNSLWIEDLGIAVFCGQGTDDTRTRQGLLVTTTDGINFNLIWTNAPDDNEEYDWMGIFWNSDRQELVLGAIGGTNPGGRMGYSQTLGETVDLPQLTFISADGLVDFPVGTAVEQDDSAATGIVAGSDPDAQTLIVKNTTGTWGPANDGRFVLGPVTGFSTGYAQLDADGNVASIRQFDPGYTTMNGDGPFNITFPADFGDGGVPDDRLPEGTTMVANVRALSDQSNFIASDTQLSNQITPT